MKILFIIPFLSYGGAEKMIAFAANTLVKQNHKVNILLYKGVPIQQIIDDKIQIINEKIIDSGSFKHLKIIRQLYKKIKKNRPDIIISFLTFPNFYSVIIGKLLGIPVIISERGNPYLKKGFKDKFIYNIFNYADGAVFQTEGAKCYFGKSLQKRSCVIPNPVVKKPYRYKYNTSIDNHEIVFVARFENVQKRQDLMIEAFEIILKQYPDAKLKFYGTGEDEDMIKQLVSNKHLNNIFFMGYTNKPEEEMVKSEVFVLTSDYEGIPNSLIEAMSVGMPVISTDCDPGGARMLIENRINGLLVKKGNSQEIANAVITIFSDNNLRNKLSQNAYRICEKYSEEVIANKWIEYINKFSK